MRDQTLDLFGEVIVTQQDVDAWLLAVPRIQPGTQRAANYVDGWGVVDKIKRAKLDGYFEAITTKPAQLHGQWWERFNWVRPVG